MNDQDLEAFKTMVIIKLEFLRGACQMHKGPTKAQIAKSIEKFIHELENPDSKKESK